MWRRSPTSRSGQKRWLLGFCTAAAASEAAAPRSPLAELQCVIQGLESRGEAAELGTYAGALQWCGRAGALEEGKRVRAVIAKHGLEANLILSNHTLNMLGRCNAAQDAQQLFDGMQKRNLFSWTGLIAAYAQNGHCKEVLKVLKEMRAEGVNPDNIALISALSACSGQESLEHGMEIHQEVVESQMDGDVMVGNALINMYTKCGSLYHAKKVFSKMSRRNVISWTSIIAAHAAHGKSKEALQHFKFMQLLGIKPNKITLTTVLTACACPATLPAGRLVHACISAAGYDSELLVGNAIVTMYGKCGSLDEARSAFAGMKHKDVVSWNIMLSAYVSADRAQEAVDIFQRMHVKADKVTYIILLNACTSTEDGTMGRLLHFQAVEDGLQDDLVVCNALISMYGKCGSHGEARKVFDGMKSRNVVSFTAMIAVYAQRKLGDKAFELFRAMQSETTTVEPDAIAMVTMLNACADLSALQQGTSVYQDVLRRGLQGDQLVGTALVNLHAKCGDLDEARRFFEAVRRPELGLWNTMLAGYASIGLSDEALQLFRLMETEGVKPDKFTFVSVLQACSHAGLVEQGRSLFTSMNEYAGVSRSVEHYGCAVDMLARGGRLGEAEEFIKRMPVQPDVVIWTSLLSACKSHGDLKRAKLVAQKCLLLHPDCSSAYVCLSNVYAAKGKWGAVANIRKLMADRGVKKEPGMSAIEIDNKVHEFVSGDESHPRSREIYAELKEMDRLMRSKGYVPDTSSVLHLVGKGEKERLLLSHSERLAISLGLLSTAPGQTLRVIKNLRVCSDCHTATKFISDITGRCIVVRDAHRFHLFKDGKCSCRDYW